VRRIARGTVRIIVTRFALMLVLAACSNGSEKAKPAVVASPPPIGPAECTTLAQGWVEHCGNDLESGKQSCLRLARLSEAASCIEQAKRSYTCGTQSFQTCTTKACCDEHEKGCDEIDRALENCLKGYCTNNGGNPDCVKTFPPATK
jgi:hypothetical protein